MAVTPESFRQQFGMFADPEIYDDLTINSWISTALIFLDANRWGDALDYGTSLYVAHNLTLMERDIRTAISGGVPGGAQGIMTAKAVDKASASYDASSISLEDGGEYNMTRFGIQFLKLARMMGSGGFQSSPQGYSMGTVDGWFGWN